MWMAKGVRGKPKKAMDGPSASMKQNDMMHKLQINMVLWAI